MSLFNKYLFSFFLFLLSSTSFIAFAENTKILSHSVIVSVAPHKFFVEKIAGNTVDVILMVPAGASMHTFEPSPRQMIAASKADIWFYIGEPFETKALQALRAHHPEMVTVDLRQGLDLITSQCCHHHHNDHDHDHSSMDLHFWLSPRMAKQQAKTIAEALIAAYPENEELYTQNLTKFLIELEKLDKEILEILAKPHNQYILVSHPAYAYFCRDYHLTQLSIEFEGRDPTSQQLTQVLQQGRAFHIKKVYIQKQYNSKGARLVANELNAKVVLLDPYSEDYLHSMIVIAKAFADQD